jgi:acetyl-CoA synthetase
MTPLTAFTRYDDAQREYAPARLWDLFDGDRQRFNIGHECLDRHAASDRAALRIAHADGRDEDLGFDRLADRSSRFAHWLTEASVAKGDRVAIMLDPSEPFYVALFGAMKRGAVAVPLFTLFGPDGIRLRVADCAPAVLITTAAKAAIVEPRPGMRLVIADEGLEAALDACPADWRCDTAASDMAMFQYTSGTTRELPEAVRHTHRALVVVMLAALYGTGIRPGDRYFCPSSPAWGHGLWHGTLAPLALGVTTGAYSGRFDAVRLMQALEDQRVTTLSAASTHYRMMRATGRASQFRFEVAKLSYTGEPIDTATLDFIDATFHVPACSMYGTTEVGVVLVSYPGAEDFAPKPASLGKPVPGARVEVQRPDGSPCAPGETGELKLWRRDAWIPTKDLGRVDADGYFWHAGRADDVIISAGWTMSAVEIEDALLKHPDVTEAAAIAIPDAVRGQVVKAFIISGRAPSDAFIAELQDIVRTRLSQHEYPRTVAFASELPKTPAGKINRKVLRDREKAQQRA